MCVFPTKITVCLKVPECPESLEGLHLLVPDPIVRPHCGEDAPDAKLNIPHDDAIIDPDVAPAILRVGLCHTLGPKIKSQTHREVV